jgi:hypothetical protein
MYFFFFGKLLINKYLHVDKNKNISFIASFILEF